MVGVQARDTTRGRFAHAILARRVGASVGATLSLLALAFTSIFTVFGQSADTLIMYAFVARIPFPRFLATLLHTLVSIPALLVVAAVILLAIVVRGRFALLLRVFLVLVLSNVSTQILKTALARPNLGVGHALANSFPSGHVTLVASIALVLVASVPPAWKTLVGVLGWVATTAVGIIVMGLGWHRFSDVVGAILIAFIFAMLALPAEWDPHQHPGRGRTAATFAWVCLLASALAIPLIIWGSRAVLAIPQTATTLQNMAAVPALGGGLVVAGSVFAASLGALSIHEVDHLRGN